MGNLASGKSALVHRYLTGTYVQEESPEGRCFAIKWAGEIWRIVKSICTLIFLTVFVLCNVILLSLYYSI